MSTTKWSSLQNLLNMESEEIIERIPAWALYYMEYGDASGLKDSEVEMVQNFYESYRNEGIAVQGVYPVSDENGNWEEYFSRNPAFGLPCSVVECSISYVTIPKENKQ